MQYITTTELRTKTAWLVKELQKGKTLTLTYYSKVIGTIVPVQQKKKVVSSSGTKDY